MTGFVVIRILGGRDPTPDRVALTFFKAKDAAFTFIKKELEHWSTMTALNADCSFQAKKQHYLTTPTDSFSSLGIDYQIRPVVYVDEEEARLPQ